MISNLIKWSTLEDLLRLKGNHWQLRTFISHPVDSGYNVSVFTTQGNRLGFYEKLGEYEARPSYRWERLNHDEEKEVEAEDGYHCFETARSGTNSNPFDYF